MYEEFTVNMDAETADWWLKTNIPNTDATGNSLNNYHRVQYTPTASTTALISQDDAEPEDIGSSIDGDPNQLSYTLKTQAEAMWEANSANIQAMLEKIVDQKFKPAPAAST